MTILQRQGLCERAPEESAKDVTARMICDHKRAHRAESGGLRDSLSTDQARENPMGFSSSCSSSSEFAVLHVRRSALSSP